MIDSFIDLNDLKLIPISAIPGLILELTGMQRHPSTIYRWTKEGCRTLDARTIKLITINRAGQLYTTKDLVMKFIQDVG